VLSTDPVHRHSSTYDSPPQVGLTAPLRVLSADHHHRQVLSVGSPQVLLLARIGSLRPLDSLPLVASCRLPLVLALAHCWSSLHPDLGPHYGMSLDLTTT
ncbi:unnamed protein product, partial [Rangifer tarandus platyrhynchus]